MSLNSSKSVVLKITPCVEQLLVILSFCEPRHPVGRISQF